MGLVIALTATGCKHKTNPGVTPLGESAHTGSPNGAQTGPGPSGTFGSDQGAGGATASNLNPNSTGIPTGSGHPGWAEDASQFAADTVYFDFDSAAIKSSESDKISAVASYLASNPGKAVKVEGHCDERGTEEYNRSLGERRALAIREELVRLGVSADRVDTISYGKDRPVDPGHNEAAWAKNRRGVFILLSPP